MSTITKQAVQAVADLKAGYTLGHADVEIIQQMALDAVALLDELEAKDATIAFQQREIRTLLVRLRMPIAPPQPGKESECEKLSQQFSQHASGDCRCHFRRRAGAERVPRALKVSTTRGFSRARWSIGQGQLSA